MTQALIMEEVGAPFRLAEVRLDTPMADEVLIDVKASGLCHSDLTTAQNDFGIPLPAVLGHEVSGIVREVGTNVSHLQPGDHVVASLQSHCGDCAACVVGDINLCAHREVCARPVGAPPRITWEGQAVFQMMDLSGFASQVLLHRNNVVRLDADIPHRLACILGCGVLTGAGAVFNAARVGFEDTVVVIGCGGLGLSAIQAARISGAAQIVAVDLSQEKLDVAREVGATDVVNSGDADMTAAILELTGGRGVDHAFDFVGRPETILGAYGAVRQAGSLYVVGMNRPGTTLTMSVGPEFLFRQVRITPVLMGSSNFLHDVPRYAQLYAQGRLNLDALVSRSITLGEVNDAYAQMASQVGRAVVEFD